MLARKLVLMCALFTVIALGAQPVLAASTMVIRLGYGHTEQHPYHQGALLFKQMLEKETQGRIKVNLYPNSQLGTESAMTEQVKLGTLTGTITGRFEEMSPKLYVSALPFLFRNLDQIERVMKSPVGEKIFSFVEEKGLKMLAWTHSGFRQVTNNVRPLRNPEDFRGLKIRTPPLENIVKTMEALGAVATPIEYTEVYTALKTGVVDGQENPYVNIWDGKFYEVQKYLSALNYIYVGSPFCVNLNWWNSLSSADQRLIKQAAVAGADRTNDLTKTLDLKAKTDIAKAGVQIYEPTEAERSEFVAKVGPVNDYFIKKGEATQELINEIKAVK